MPTPKLTQVKAGPGTGKSWRVVDEVLALLRAGADHRRILGLTFSRKAARHLQRQFDRRSTAEGCFRPVRFSTFHAFCGQLLQAHARRVRLPGDQPLPRSFRVLGGLEARVLLQRVAEDVAREDTGARLAPQVRRAGTAGDLLRLFDLFKSNQLDPGGLAPLAQPGTLVSEAARLWSVYQQQVWALGLLDYADLQLLALRLLEREPDVLMQLHAEYGHVLVDEFQDTDPLQFELLAKLVGEDTSVLVVGDDNQAIYRFRGARPENLTALLSARFDGVVHETLRTSYRAPQRLLDIAEQHLALHDGEPVGLVSAPDVAGVVATTGAITHKDQHAEITWLATQVGHWLTAGRIDAAGGPRAARPDEVCVLVRSNALVRRVADGLTRAGIPVAAAGETPAAREVRRLIADAVTVLGHRADPPPSHAERDERVRANVALSRLLACATLHGGGLAESAQLDILLRIGGADRRCRALHRDLREALGPGADGPVAFVLGLLDKAQATLATHGPLPALTELLPPLVSQTRDLPGFERRLAALGEVSDRLAGIASVLAVAGRPPLRIRELDDLLPTLWSEPGSTGAGVVIQTAHQAKGLEYPVVFVVGVSEELFPSRYRSLNLIPEGEFTALVDAFEAATGRAAYFPGIYDNPADFQAEELRLLYVALTRARQVLFVSSHEVREGNTYGPSEPFFTLEDALGTVAAPTSAAPEAHAGEPAMPPRQVAPDPATPVLEGTTARYSHTRVSTLAQCQRLHFYRDLLRLEVEEDRSRLRHGSLVHYVLERLNRDFGRAERTFPRALELMDVVLTEEAEDLRWATPLELAFSLRFARAALAALFESGHYPRPVLGVDTLAGQSPVWVENAIAGELAGHGFKGFVDVVYHDAEAREIEIVDYKTSRSAGSHRDPDNNRRMAIQAFAEWDSKKVRFPSFQLPIYHLLTEGSWPPDHRVMVAFHYVRPPWQGGGPSVVSLPVGEAFGLEASHLADARAALTSLLGDAAVATFFAKTRLHERCGAYGARCAFRALCDRIGE